MKKLNKKEIFIAGSVAGAGATLSSFVVYKICVFLTGVFPDPKSTEITTLVKFLISTVIIAIAVVLWRNRVDLEGEDYVDPPV